jgi:muconolactone delta-isomerase
MGTKFLVLWELDLSRMRGDFASVLMRMPEYAQKVRERGKLVGRYHIVGKHGGAWIYEVDSNEELERLLAMAPVYNFAKYEVLPLAEMDTPANVYKPDEK